MIPITLSTEVQPTPEKAWIGLIGLFLIAWLIAGWVEFFRRGILTRRAFADAPPRRGVMGLGELIIFSVLVLGPAAFKLWTSQRLGEQATEADFQYSEGLKAIGLILAFLFAIWRGVVSVEGGLFRGFGLDPRQIPRSLWRASCAFFVLIPVTTLISACVVMTVEWLGRDQDQTGHVSLKEIQQTVVGTPDWWGIILTVVILGPLIEEVIFRGLVQTSLLQSGISRNRWTIITCAAVPFAFVHFGLVTPVAFPGLFLLGVAFGWVYEKWGSLWTAIFLHAMFNAWNVAVAVWLQPWLERVQPPT